MDIRESVTKLTRTTRHLSSLRERQGFDGFSSLAEPPPPSPPNRRFAPRLTWGVTPKQVYDIGEMCNFIAMENNLTFFCDTSIFHRSTDERLWEALLNRPGKVVIIPHVHDELGPWLATNPTHMAAQAIAQKRHAIRFFDLPSDDERTKTAYIYYVNLLAMRKRLFDVEQWRFERAHGRPPDEREMATIRSNIHKMVGPRGYLIASKGDRDASSRTYYTDEALVYLATMTAITTGSEVVILTKDEDIQEQFYKLLWLMDTHYRGMLLADRYASDPFGFIHRAPPVGNERFDEVFAADNLTLIERSESLLNDILPPTCTAVPIYCWVIGDKMTSMTFMAEKEMKRLLDVKGDTGGLNTDRLDGRNCHIWLAPHALPASLRGCAAIAYDRRAPLPPSKVAIPMHDFDQTLNNMERFTHTLESSHPGVTLVTNHVIPVYRR